MRISPRPEWHFLKKNSGRPIIQTLAACTLFLSGCGSEFNCSTPANPLPKANAGCFVARDGTLLAIQQRTGLWGLPGGAAQWGESAQCTAERETWEETGLAVEVGELARVFDNGFHLFYCQSSSTSPALNPRDKAEVKAARWLPAHEFEQLDWRFPRQESEFQQLMMQAP